MTRIGRPPLYEDGLATARLELRVTPAQLVDLRGIAAENGLTLGGVIRQAALEYVAEHDERQSRVPPRRVDTRSQS